MRGGKTIWDGRNDVVKGWTMGEEERIRILDKYGWTCGIIG